MIDRRIVLSAVLPISDDQVVAHMTDVPPVPTISGGWEVTPRPRRKSFVSWGGQALVTLEMPLLLEGFRQNLPVEREISQLEAWCRVRTELGHPTVVVADGYYPYSSMWWVIAAITHGGSLRRQEDGQRVRQYLTLSLIEYNPVETQLIRTQTPAQRSAPKASGKTYRVTKGDTLLTIAAKLYGAASKWVDIADLNDIRDPKMLTAGQVLKLP